MRELINRFGVYILIVVVVAAAVLFYFFNRGTASPKPNETKAFYIDEESGQESVRPVTDVPPLDGAGGKPTVVQAVKYTCGDSKTMKIAYLLKYTDEGKAAMEQIFTSKVSHEPNISMRDNTLVRSPEAGSKWVSLNSDEGETIANSFPCDEGKPKPVLPP